MKNEALFKMIVAALSLWEGADDPNSNPEYVRGQAETIARFMQAEGWDIPSGGVTDTLLAAAGNVALFRHGASTMPEAQRVYDILIS